MEWIQNIGTELKAPKSVKVDWGNQTPPYPGWNWWKPEADELVTQWRTTPYAIDWNEDGIMDLDLLVNSLNISLFEQISQSPDKVVFKHTGPLTEQVLAGHTTSPTFVDWDGNGIWEVLAGSEDGHFYHLSR